jgi:serine/threonine protein kinase/Tol biopolymer transport system component
MSLTSGTRLGPYEIVSAIGAGGMGEVYKATDTRLKRAVAIKILPESFAGDPERLARFQREAEVLASINHPHIAAIYGIEESGGTRALVMELVEGEDLSQRIARGPIPIDEALSIAKQIAEALEAAHEQGITHRDLMPANFKVTPNGDVKVLDFGLAKLTDPAHAPASNLSLSPTITSPAMMTGVGVLLGTAAYMSPEQAKGREADKRADVWAFGCVLFEMLTGKTAFGRNDVADTLASVLRDEPDWTALPRDLSPALRILIARCLEKERRIRIGDITAARFVIDEHSRFGDAPTRKHRNPWRIAAVCSGLAVLIAGIAAARLALVRADPSEPATSRLLLAGSNAALPTVSEADVFLAITPDGSRVVYVGNRGTQLLVRALDTVEPLAIYTGQPRSPFISPDGRWIGFIDGTTTMRKVPVTGGPAITITTIDGTPRGATWGADGTIVFATTNATTGLQRVAATGGPVTVLTTVKNGVDHRWPEFLPAADRVLFTIVNGTSLDAAQIAAFDLRTRKTTMLVEGGSHGRFLPRDDRSPATDGYLTYATASSLWAVPFAASTATVHGTAAPVVPHIAVTGTGGAYAAMSANGTLAYVPEGSRGAGLLRQLVWVDRHGAEYPISAPARPYTSPRLSPDGTRVALNINDANQDLWILDLLRNALTRVTFDPKQDYTPLWSVDGRQLIFSSDRTGRQTLYVESADGAGNATPLTQNAEFPQHPTGITPDGQSIVFDELSAARQTDLWLLTLTPTRAVHPLLQSSFVESNGTISRDGRWLAYESNSSGRDEIYVRSFPNVNGGQWQVSTAGGRQPVWSRNGRELFYVAPNGALFGAPIDSRGSVPVTSAPSKILNAGYYTGVGGAGGANTPQYDVSADGQRFLMLKEANDSIAADAIPNIVVVQQWRRELQRLMAEAK